jgi:hypothetical protein
VRRGPHDVAAHSEIFPGHVRDASPPSDSGSTRSTAVHGLGNLDFAGLDPPDPSSFVREISGPAYMSISWTGKVNWNVAAYPLPGRSCAITAGVGF